MNPAYDEPSEQTVRMLEASADEDISMASLPEMGITKVQTNPSSTKKEPTSAESKNATNNPNTGSAELPKKKLKRMAEVYTTEPTKAFKGLTGEKLFDGSSVSSQLHSVPELKDTTSEQFAHFIQKSVRSFTEEQEKVLEAISLLHGDKKELEKENALLKAEVVQLREKDNEIGLLHEEKKELEKENASLKTEIFKLQDKENEIVLLQEGKMKLQKENDLLKTRVSQLQDRENEDKKELRIKNDLLKLNVSRLQDRGYETAQLQGYNKELQIKNDLLTSKVSWLEYQNYEITQLRGYKEKLQTENYTSQVSWLQDREQEFQAENDMLKSKVSRLQVVSDDRGQLLKVYTWKLLKTRAFAKFFEDLKTSAKKVGRHEAVEKMQIRYPDLKPKAFIGLEDPLAESKLDDQFFSMIQDDGFEIPLLNHLLSVEEVPNSSELKHLDEDEDRNALIRKNPTSTK